MQKLMMGILAAAVVIMSTGLAEARLLQPGVRIGHYSKADGFMVGGDLKFGLAMLSADPNIELVFGNNVNQYAGNFDVFFDFSFIPKLAVYAGGGAGIIYTDPQNSNGKTSTDGAINLIGGAGINILLDPYFQVKYIISNDNQWVWTIGIRF